MEFIDVEPADVKPGDLALHKSGKFDDREVIAVNHSTKELRLRIGTLPSRWIPISNYTFQRSVE